MRTHSMLRFISIALVILFFGGVNLFAQVKVLEVEPGQTDTSIETVHGPNIALYDTQVPSRHLLILFIVGTGGRATGTRTMDSIFAIMGYHAITIDYEDNVVAVACAHSKDSTEFDRYRDAIITGAPVSALVKVDTANSILNRFQKLLVYLVKHDPDGGWKEFVESDRPRWGKIVVAGHSQGSGHAAYIGKMFEVSRVLMFSGPQDYLDDLHRPAPWQEWKSATPVSRYFAFLNLKDPFNIKHQLANDMVLIHLSKPDTIMVTPGEVIHSDKHILVNNIPTKSPHGSTLFPIFKNVWEYMLTANDK